MWISLRYRMIDGREADGDRVTIGVAFEDDVNPTPGQVSFFYDNRFQPPVTKRLEDVESTDIRPRWSPTNVRFSEIHEARVPQGSLVEEINRLMDRHLASLRHTS